MVTARPATLVTVSVVNMPRAAESRQAALSPSFTAAAAMPCSILSMGRKAPITPVESTRTCSSLAPQAAAASRVICRASSSPRWPVQALATPEQITTARIRSLGVRLRSNSTGAATTRFCVYTPTPVAAVSDMTSDRSGLCASRLMRQWTPANRKPLGTRIVMRELSATRPSFPDSRT